ncbi:TIGR01777 family oxidoreductase [bacterium]|nr:TIGR01777 family oxidoreductase [bacterium]
MKSGLDPSGDVKKKVTGRFTQKSTFAVPVEALFGWHAREGAIERLSPPWDPIQVIHKSGGIKTGATVILGMKEGPVRYHWHALHTDYEENRMFRDIETRGPLSSWVHTHRFESLDGNRSSLEDTIEYKPFFAPITGLMADFFVRKRLSRIFAWRHRTTAADLELHQRFQHLPRKKVLISGASGVLGRKLIPFLTTGGHSVLTLVRRQPQTATEIFWDPARGILNADDLVGVDAVIHLSGENVGEGRWTAEKRRRIIESRVSTTYLLAERVSSLNPKPGVFISASATGIYGDRKDDCLSEDEIAGNGFLATVCDHWENAVQPALDNGMRTALMRIGVVLTPEGGALQKLLLPYQMGLGGRMGSGKQYISWIGIDDALAAFYWALMNEDISGPVNVVSPNPVTYLDFTRTLASVLSRPAVLPFPAFLIKLFFGQMGVEGILFSTRAKPTRLLDTGFNFRHSNLEEVFKHVLGK